MKSDLDNSKATDYLWRVVQRLNATRAARTTRVSDQADLLDLVDHVYSVGSFQGFSAKLSEGELQKVLNDDEVDYVEEDQYYKYQACVTTSTYGHPVSSENILFLWCVVFVSSLLDRIWTD
ncbi:hypothetical protein QOT17_022613 [Balamuthia mandrillaris]